jgi:hypothetical protein
MNTVATTHEAPGTIPLDAPSTVLTPRGSEQSGGGRMALSEPAEKPASIESVLEKELADIRGKEGDAKEPDAKPVEAKDKAPEKDAKAEVEEKPAKPRAEDGKFAKAEKAETQPEAKADQGEPAKAAEQAAPERRQSEGRHPEPPARFLPEARAKWANVPNEVKAEVHRVSQEMERESQQLRASHERYSQLKDFDDLARSNGRDLRESLTKVNEIENSLRQNPIAGLDAVLREIGPRRQDGSPLTIMDVAQFLSQNPQAYQPSMAVSAPPQAQPPQTNQEIEALKAEIMSMRAEQTVVPVINAFADTHPDFGALESGIVEILNSGVIEKLHGNGLSLEQRLSEAYRMAGGQGPSSRPDTDLSAAHSAVTTERPVNPDAGTKSVRGAPANGFDPATEDADSDIESVLRKEMRKLRS